MTKELNRKLAPEIKSIESVKMEAPKLYELSNGAEVVVFNNDNQNLLKIEFVFKNGGSAYSAKPFLASIANALITESTSNYSSAVLADKVDYFGASFETKAFKDYSSVSLYTLNKFIKQTLPLLHDVIINSSYEQKELDIHIARKKQEFLVNSEKVDFIARQNFTKLLFGENHPYGKASKIEDYDNITNEDLINFHSKVYKQGPHKIYIAGKFGEDEFKILNSLFGNINVKNDVANSISWDIEPNKNKYVFIKKEDAVQNAIRLGFKGLKHDHEDYHGLRILTSFLGGYFGSRLMSNIREDKGYTYGIGAAHSSFEKESVFFIATEVKSEVADDTLFEIKKELKILQEQKITDDELTTVKNYLQGSFQSQFDSSFALVDKYIYLDNNNLDYSFYYDYINQVKEIDADRLLMLAKKYYSIENFYILNVGN